jgi:hypothetical protein
MRKISIAIHHQSGEAVRDFHSQCIVESNRANTSMSNLSMMERNAYIKRTLKLIMGICQTLGKRQTHSNNIGLMGHPINER